MPLKPLPAMKRVLLAIVLGSSLLTGCTRHYVITLNNGARITTVGKPQLQRGSYVFKDAKGQPAAVPAGRVREVAPASMVKDENSQFKSSTGR